MAVRALEICVLALDPARVARFWGAVLEREVVDEVELPSPDGLAPRLVVRPTSEVKAGLNRMHLDLTSSSYDDQRLAVQRALAQGGRHADVGQRPDELHVVLADPEGNELCVIEPGNRFLEGCGRIGAFNWDGTQAVGYFWGALLGWPLVWDQDEETAIQSPAGGMKIAWGGPPVAPKHGTSRLHLHLVPTGGTHLLDAVEQAVALGAAMRSPSPCEPEAVMLADPDGNDFCLLPG